MASDSSKTAETQALSLSASDQALTFAGGIQQVYLSTTTDCYVDFDETATTSSLLLKANLAPVRIDFRGGNIGTVHAIGTTGTLYALGVRN